MAKYPFAVKEPLVADSVDKTSDGMCAVYLKMQCCLY